MSKNTYIKCIFLEFKHHKLKIFSHTQWSIQVRENSTSILKRENPKEFKELSKDVFLRLILKDKGGKQHWLTSVLEVEIFLKKRADQKKGTLKQEIEASLYNLYRSFKKIPFTLYTHVFDKILQNRAKFIQKPTPGFKDHMGNLENFR